MDKDKIYNLIDADDSLTDEEKRQEYLSEIEQEEFADNEYDIGN
jgi:hypothetical protein